MGYFKLYFNKRLFLKILWNITVIFIVILFQLPVFGKIEGIRFDHLTSANKLSDDLIFSIFQDSKGFMWIGTSNGLNRYDGKIIKSFYNDPHEKNSICHNVIVGICEDKNRDLWFATYGGGISKFDHTSNGFINFKNDPNEKNSLSSNTINHILADTEGYLWISTQDGGLNRLDPETGKFRHFRLNKQKNNSISSDKIIFTLEDSKGILWIATWGGGLCKFEKNRNLFSAYKHDPSKSDSISGNRITTIIEDFNNILWIGTDSEGLNRFDPSTEKFVKYKKNSTGSKLISDNTIRSISRENDNMNLLWIGTNSGLSILDKKSGEISIIKKNNSKNGLSHNYIWEIFIDRSGLIWIGTVGGGINIARRYKKNFKHYTNSRVKNSNLSSERVGAIYRSEHDPEIYWIGTLGGGLNKINKKSGGNTVFKKDDKISAPITSNNITCLTGNPSDPDILYIGTDSGLNKLSLEDNSFSRFEATTEKNKSFNNAYISYMVSTPATNEILWIGTFGNGMFKLNMQSGTINNYFFEKKKKNDLNANRVYAIHPSITNKDILWLGTNTGLAKFSIQNEKFIFFKSLPEDYKSISSNTILSIYESNYAPGFLWLGTNSGGLNHFDINRKIFSHFDRKSGLADNTILSIIEEPDGILWLSTLRGISQFRIDTKVFRNFNKKDGLINTGYLPGSSYKSPDGKIMFGGTNGIDCFNPSRFFINKTIPQIAITDLRIFNKSVTPGNSSILTKDISRVDKIILPVKYNVFTLTFASLDFTDPEKNLYLCKMEGYNQDWVDLKTKNSITFSNLKPGEYKFRVKGSNNDGIWNNVGRTLIVYIKPGFIQFWRSGIILFIIILLISGIFILRKFRMGSTIQAGKDHESFFSRRNITDREREIIRYILEGKSNKEIEDILFISIGTVKNHIYNIYKKLNVKSRTKLMKLFRDFKEEDFNH